MKIMFSTDQVYRHGGIEKVVATKANYMVSEWGWDVCILTTEQNGKAARYHLHEDIEIIDLGINYNRQRSYYHPLNVWKAMKHWKSLRRTIAKLRPDVIIVCNYAFDFYFWPFIRKNACLVKEYHGSGYGSDKDTKGGFLRSMGQSLYDGIKKKYDFLMLLTPEEKRYHRGKELRIMPNPIALTDQRAKLESRKVMAAGRVAPIKGFDRLINIWAEVVKDFPDWELHIYGEDYLNTKSKLQVQIRDLKLGNNVFLKDAALNMRDIMSDYSMFLLSSHVEPFGMVILESQSVGLPVIAFDVPHGPRNIIRHGIDGILVENKDLQAFADAVKNLMADQDKRLRMGGEAKRNAEKFAVGKVMQEWARLILPQVKGRS